MANCANGDSSKNGVRRLETRRRVLGMRSLATETR
jgi:hypothetical protein